METKIFDEGLNVAETYIAATDEQFTFT